jgi:class 3 adenylate cyclase/tetratricopeptide (TPR) repeat protein
MECLACGRENREGAKFCDECGSRLAVGTGPQAPRVHIRPPSQMVEKILRSRASIEGERKHVTVMFADVKGSMDLSEDVDPEEWRSIIERFFEIMNEGVHRFEGTVNQFLGDGIMALFGAPIAHEDHAHRACFAALHLRETLGLYARELRRERGLSFSVRMGLNSGEVVVGGVGDDMHMEYTAVGHTVGLAARIEQLAAPGTVYVSADTADLVTGFFDVEDLGTFGIKGVRDPIRLFELKGVGAHRTRFDVAAARGLSRFVGRREETAVLGEALDAVEGGRGQIVGVVGEAGVGKSRLCYEFVQRARSSGTKVFEAHGLPHGRGLPFLPVLQLLRGYFGIEDVDGPVAARQKIAGSLLLLDEGFRDDLALVFDFLGVPDPDLPYPQLDPDARIARLYGILGHLIRARSDRGPALILIEDLQWLDEGSLAFVDHLVEAVPDTRTMLVVNHRPPFRPGWTAHTTYRQISLGPLDADDIAELVHDRLGDDASLRPLARYVEGRTSGNPFFIEELLRSLVESGVLAGEPGAYKLVGPLDETVVPPTVQAVVAARVDRLGEREKSVLQTAAVIGPEIPRRVLEQVSGLPAYELDAALRQLIESDFLVERTVYPEAEYAFKHPLTEEVAYRSQLGENRRRVHADVARATMDVFSDRLDERASLLAHHFSNAGERLESARWHRRAAEWAAHNDTTAALRHWRAVRDHTGAFPSDSDAEALALAACIGILNLGPRHGLSEAEAQALFDEGRTLCATREDQRSLARLLLVFARYRGVSGDIAQASALSLEAGTIAQQVGLRGLRLAAAVNLSTWATQFGDLTRSLAIVEDALRDVPGNVRVGTEHLGYSPYIWLAMHRGRLLTYMGRTTDAHEALDRALDLARDNAELEIACWAHQGQVDLAYLVGDELSAMAHARLAVEIAERIGTLFALWSSYHALGRAHTVAGEPDEAIAALSKALTVMRDRRTGLHLQLLVRASLAEAHLLAGQPDRARFCAEEALNATERAEIDSPLAARARTILAHARRASKQGNPAVERAALLHCLEVLHSATYLSLLPDVHIELAELARAAGDDEAFAREIAEAKQLLDGMGATARAEALV